MNRREGRRFFLEFCLVMVQGWIAVLGWLEGEIRRGLSDG